MSNALYRKALQAMALSTFPDLSAATIKAANVGPGYVPDLVADEFKTSIDSHIVGAPVTLTGVTVANGVLDADDASFAAVAAGSTVSAVVLFIDTGVSGTSRLLAYIDTITGYPYVTANKVEIVRWSNGSYKIFSL